MVRPTRKISPAARVVGKAIPDIRIGFLLSPCFAFLPFAGFLDTLCHSADDGDGVSLPNCQWSIVGPNLDPVQASCGVEVSPQQTYGTPANFDYIVIVGGLLRCLPPHATETLDFLCRADRHHVPVVGLHTGSFSMAEAGLLDGKRCSIHFRHRAEFQRRYPKAKPANDGPYTFDGNAITCTGGTAAIGLAVEIVARHRGGVNELRRLSDPGTDGRQGNLHIPNFPCEELLNCGNWRVERAVLFMRNSLSARYTVLFLAQLVGTSVSQLDRAFIGHTGMTAARLWRTMRLYYARWRLVSTRRTVTAISQECGFADCAHLVRRFKREFGVTPSGLRKEQRNALDRSAVGTTSSDESRAFEDPRTESAAR